jgi:hypothetical protein
MDLPTTGDRYLGSTGRIWTVGHVAPARGRIVLTGTDAVGDRVIVVDGAALARMIPLEEHPIERATATIGSSHGRRLAERV